MRLSRKPTMQVHALSTFRHQQCALVISILGLSLAILLGLTMLESVHARHSPNRYDRRPDRETHIPYSRTSAQPNTRPVIVIHSPPQAAEETTSETANETARGQEPETPPAD